MLAPSKSDDDLPLDPFQAAMASRDSDVLTMVRDALIAGRTKMAYQPIMLAGSKPGIAFYEVVIRFMADMQPRGVAFALDGFGAGLTAFRHLKDFFFDLVKIDKSFIHGICDDPDNQVVVEALIMVAHQFEMFVVADGVETAKDAAFMTELGADCLQGYHFGVPKFDI